MTKGTMPGERTQLQGLSSVNGHAPARIGQRILKRITTKSWMALRTDYKLIMLTFELFWIVVFLLDRIGQATNGGVPQFVYVNF